MDQQVLQVSVQPAVSDDDQLEVQDVSDDDGCDVTASEAHKMEHLEVKPDAGGAAEAPGDCQLAFRTPAPPAPIPTPRQAAAPENLEAEPDEEGAWGQLEVAPPPGLAPDRDSWPNKAERDELEKDGSIFEDWERVSLCKQCQKAVIEEPPCKQCQKAVSSQWQQCWQCQKKAAAAAESAVSACPQCRPTVAGPSSGILTAVPIAAMPYSPRISSAISGPQGAMAEEAGAQSKMSMSQYQQWQWYRVKDKDGNVRFWKKKQKNWKVAVYVNLTNILLVDTKANKFQADFFLRLMWSEHVDTADKADRFTRHCKFDRFYDDSEPIKNDSTAKDFKPNGVCAIFCVSPDLRLLLCRLF